MSRSAEQRTARRAQAHAVTRSAILDAARRVAARDDGREFSLRGVAAEAGFVPAALYGYFGGKDDLLLALAADDLSHLARAMREASRGDDKGKLAAASAAALSMLHGAQSISGALGALPGAGTSEAERLFNGRMIAALKVLSEASGSDAATRDGQCDVVLTAAAVMGLAMLARSGRLAALGFRTDEILARLDARFSN
ncbi:MAG: helix-turn-helix domain-containing protein [Rhizomicrobium sp.]